MVLEHCTSIYLVYVYPQYKKESQTGTGMLFQHDGTFLLSMLYFYKTKNIRYWTGHIMSEILVSTMEDQGWDWNDKIIKLEVNPGCSEELLDDDVMSGCLT